MGVGWIRFQSFPALRPRSSIRPRRTALRFQAYSTCGHPLPGLGPRNTRRSRVRALRSAAPSASGLGPAAAMKCRRCFARLPARALLCPQPACGGALSELALQPVSAAGHVLRRRKFRPPSSGAAGPAMGRQTSRSKAARQRQAPSTRAFHQEQRATSRASRSLRAGARPRNPRPRFLAGDQHLTLEHLKRRLYLKPTGFSTTLAPSPLATAPSGSEPLTVFDPIPGRPAGPARWSNQQGA